MKGNSDAVRWGPFSPTTAPCSPPAQHSPIVQVGAMARRDATPRWHGAAHQEATGAARVQKHVATPGHLGVIAALPQAASPAAVLPGKKKELE